MLSLDLKLALYIHNVSLLRIEIVNEVWNLILCLLFGTRTSWKVCERSIIVMYNKLNEEPNSSVIWEFSSYFTTGGDEKRLPVTKASVFSFSSARTQVIGFRQSAAHQKQLIGMIVEREEEEEKQVRRRKVVSSHFGATKACMRQQRRIILSFDLVCFNAPFTKQVS